MRGAGGSLPGKHLRLEAGLLILSLTSACLEKGVRVRKVCGAAGSSLAEKGDFSPLPL